MNDKQYEFDLVGTTAQDYVWKLLKTHCNFNPSFNFRLVDERTISEILLTELQEEDPNNYPMGKEFVFTHFVKNNKGWFVEKKPEYQIKIKIDTRRVTRIAGKLNFLFTIYFDYMKITIGKDVTIASLDE